MAEVGSTFTAVEVVDRGIGTDEAATTVEKKTTRGQCCISPPSCDYQALGHDETWNSLPVYIAGPSLSPAPSSAVLIISDIYGWRVPQTRQLADKIAAAGHFVVVPDFMEGEPYASTDPNQEYGGLHEYLERHSKRKAINHAKEVLEKIHTMGFHVIGAAGFCWGAKILVNLLKGDTAVGAGIMCHPSFLTTDDIKEVKVPLAILGAEIDIITPPKMVLEFESILKASPDVGHQSYCNIYPDADHGWTTRYEPNNLEARNRAETAHGDIISWFQTHLHRSTSADSQSENT